jgi:NAD-dependent deacetylase
VTHPKERPVPNVRERLKQPTGRLFVLSGAGISTSAGLPTYRGTGGLYPSGALIPLHASAATSSRVGGLWDTLRPLMVGASTAAPTRAHQALADLTKRGWQVSVATQNVDGLHSAAALDDAGQYEVIDLHGNLLTARCLNPGCRTKTPAPLEPSPHHADGVHRCELCGGRLRPDIVLFGENLDPAGFTRAQAAAGAADVVLAVGTSLQVHPAAGLVEHALALGAQGAWLDLDPAAMLSELEAYDQSVFGRMEPISGPCDDTLPALLAD